MNARVCNILLSVGLIALSIYLIIESRSFSAQAAMLPVLLAACFIGAAIILLVSALKKGTRAGSAELYPFGEVPWGLWIGVVVAFFLFTLGVVVIGFYEAAFLFLVVATWIMSSGEPQLSRRVVSSLVFAVAFDAVIYFLFATVLRVPTPPGILL